MQDQLKTFLNSIHPVPDEILKEYIHDWEPLSLPKKSFLTREGTIQKHWLYVAEGFQKSYYLKDGKSHVIAFTYAPSFTGIPESFFTQSPSRYFLETITDSQFLRVSYQKHMEMIEKHRALETLFRKFTEQVLVGLLHRYYELMALDIESRFRSFMQRSPHLLNQISHKDLASYLRIDPTNFSKLLGKIKI